MTTSEHTMTKEIAEYIVREKFESLPEEVVRLAKRCVVDGTGVMLAGSASDSGHVIQRYVSESSTGGPATVAGSSLKAPASLAALANGVAAHALDYDDTQLSSTPDRIYGLMTHPTSPVLAATLAVGQEVRASGKDVITAFSTGFEVECKIAEAIDPHHYVRGMHSTGSLGIFGATAAAAKLFGLDVEQTRMALGIAASKSAGIRVNFGTMAKPYHAGAAAENGIVAARLAGMGYEANSDGLDGTWGFFQVTAGGGEQDRIMGKLGNPYAMVDPGFSIKPYPCGSMVHPAMDTLRDMVIEADIQPEQIKVIRCATQSHVLAGLRYTDPQDELQAKFSMNFCLGIIALRRKAGIAEFTNEVVLLPEVREMICRVSAYADPNVEAEGADRMRSMVEVELNNGQVLTRTATMSRGMPQRPMMSEELTEKFTDCASGVIPSDRIARVIEAAYALDALGDINDYMALLG
jgi:2-methylcitrate dehydratase PrpD